MRYLLILAYCISLEFTTSFTSPRLQWNENHGYCGEVSLISAGLYYGQYLSQYDARSLACNGGSQTGNQLLLGINDQQAAKAMRLQATTWPNASQDSNSFLAWVSEHVNEGHPVAIGLYTNEYLFYGDTDPTAGDDEYDHIVPVLSMDEDNITFSDNGLWGDAKDPQYLFTYPLSTFVATRKEANNPNGQVYSLSKETNNYGIAITGILDEDDETLPVRVTTNLNYEYPEIANKSSKRPAPMPLTLEITIQNLEPGILYTLYRYNDFSKVPTSSFNAHASDATKSWQIQITSGSTYQLTDSTLSDTSAIYRCVKADS